MTAPATRTQPPTPVPADFAERLEFLDFGPGDVRLLEDFGHRYADVAQALLERFYEHLLAFPRTRALLDGSPLDHLKQAQTRHFAQLFGGEYGRSFAADRVQVGAIHQRVGLEPAWYIGSYALYLRLLLPAILDHAAGDPRRQQASLEAVIKAVFLDLSLALDAYGDAKERDLRALQERADRILATVPVGLVVLDGGLRVLSSNRAFGDAFARGANAPPQPLPALLGAPELERHLREVGASGRGRTGLLLTLRPGGHVRTARVAVAPLVGPAGDPAQLLCAIEDLGAELQLTARLRESDRRFHEVMERASDAMILVRADGAVASLNQAAEELIGAPRATRLGRPFVELFGEADRDALQVVLGRCAGRPPAGPGPAPPGRAPGRAPAPRPAADTARALAPLESVLRVELRGADGTPRPVEVRLRSERADGDLVCLAVVRPRGAPAAVRPDDDGFAATAAQAALVARHLRAVTAADPDAATLVDVRAVLAAVLDLARPALELRARLTTDYGEVPLVAADAAALAQVCHALVANAAEAIPAGDPARHEVRVRTWAHAGHALVEVSDTGGGIPATVQPRLFEPFFTTKGAGRGAGLGLALARLVATALGGGIEIESEPGAGATFRVRLPGARLDLPPAPPLGEPPTLLEVPR